MNTITNILSTIETATGIEPIPFSSSTINTLPSITFIAYRQGDNAVVES